MSVSDDAIAEHAQLVAGTGDEFVRQQGREGPATYSPHQLLTGGGIPPAGHYVDPTETAPEPTVEHFPIGESDAHAGTYTLGRPDA